MFRATAGEINKRGATTARARASMVFSKSPWFFFPLFNATARYPSERFIGTRAMGNERFYGAFQNADVIFVRACLPLSLSFLALPRGVAVTLSRRGILTMSLRNIRCLSRRRRGYSCDGDARRVKRGAHTSPKREEEKKKIDHVCEQRVYGIRASEICAHRRAPKSADCYQPLTG